MICKFENCPIGYLGACDSFVTCIVEEFNHAGYQVYQESQHESEKSPVATRVRLGDSERSLESNSNQGGERGSEETSLTQEEVKKLRKHMALWAD